MKSTQSRLPTSSQELEDVARPPASSQVLEDVAIERLDDGDNWEEVVEDDVAVGGGDCSCPCGRPDNEECMVACDHKE